MSAEENKAIIYRFVNEALNQRNIMLIDEVYSLDYVGHDPLRPNARRIDDLKYAILVMLEQVFPDAFYVTESLVAEDDMVVWQWTLEATHQGEWMNILPTGKTVAFGGVNIFRMANCKVVEDWVYRDLPGLMRQIGVRTGLENLFPGDLHRNR